MFIETICFVSMLTGHHSCPNEKVIPVQNESRSGVVVYQTHAGSEDGLTHISGIVKKGFGPGEVSAANTHLDITATRNGKVIRAIATDFFPKTIPATRQGTPGRSRFAVKIDELPPDAKIAVSVHREPLGACRISGTGY
ncbi:MAG: hypothetical protein ACFUZC_22235 [Chthoniobacteraceae bacterium]